MFEIILSVLTNFIILSCIFLCWKVIGVIHRTSKGASDLPVKTGERSAHSNLSLITVGVIGFFLFPILLVGTPWKELGTQISAAGHVHILGFLITGVVSYLYFVKSLKGDAK